MLKNMEPLKRKWLKRVFFVVIVLFVAGTTIWQTFKSPDDSFVPSNTVGADPSVVSTLNPPVFNPPATTPPTTTVPPPKPPGPSPPDMRAAQPNTKAAAVKAAQIALNNLSAGTFLVNKGADGKYHPSKQLVAMVKHLVAPNKQKFTLESAPHNARAMTIGLHWPSVEAASVGANYYVEALQYKVTSFGHGKATIWLSTKSNYTSLPSSTDSGGDHHAPDLTVVRMVRVKGKWLFVDSQEPPQVEATFNRMGRGLDYSVYEDALRPFMTGGFRNANDLR